METEAGVSSKAGNGINMGLGLPMVRQGAADGGFEVTVARLKDATGIQEGAGGVIVVSLYGGKANFRQKDTQ